MSLVYVITDILTFMQTEMSKFTALNTEQEFIPFSKILDDFAYVK